MRTVLNALADELRRLKSTGVETVSVSDKSLEALRLAVGAAAARRALPAALPQLTASDSAARSTASQPASPGSASPQPAAAKSAPPRPSVLAPRVDLPQGDKQAQWNYLKDKVLNDPNCLAHVRPGRRLVLGVGSLDASIFFVGEAPGADEELKGEPFVGPAGQLLTKMIAGMGLSREQVYIGNIMNWRPELPAGPDGVQYGNRPPTPEEMAYCLPYLKAQIAVVRPRILVALGATAALGLLGPGVFKALSEVRGSWREFAGVPLIVTYHPSYILRNPINRSKRLIWEDLLKVMERAELSISDKQRGYFLER